MKKNLFEMGAKIKEGWEADNKMRPKTQKTQETHPPQAHRLYVQKEKRRGKNVTVVAPFFLAEKELKTLLKHLKKKLGTGGTLKGDSLEFQGDVGEAVRQALQTQGFGFKH